MNKISFNNWTQIFLSMIFLIIISVISLMEG